MQNFTPKPQKDINLYLLKKQFLLYMDFICQFYCYCFSHWAREVEENLFKKVEKITQFQKLYNKQKQLILINIKIGTQFDYINILQKTNLMVEWMVKDSIYKPIWSFIRLLFNYAIYSSILHEPGFTDQLCGPLAIPAQSELLNYVITIEVFNFSFPFILILISRLANGNEKFRKLSQFRFLKVFLVMLLKMFIVFNKVQRRKYYFHVFLIQLLIWFCTIFYDCIGYPKIAQTWQIIFTDSFQRISIFYTITRTFCPNLAIYWFFTNLMLLIISQLQAHVLYYYPASERLDPIFPSALYVKQDIYRFMVLTFVYFGLFSFFQSKDYGYGMIIVFLLTFLPFIKAIKMVQSDEFKKSTILMTIICLLIQGLVFVRINNPSLFKVFLPKGSNTCGIFDEIQL